MDVKPGTASPGRAAGNAARYLTTLAGMTSASGAVLFIESQHTGAAPVLLTAGRVDALPEFVDPGAATEAVTLLGGSVSDSDSDSDTVTAPIQVFPRPDDGACLLRIAPFSRQPLPKADGDRQERRAAPRTNDPRMRPPRVWIGMSFDSQGALDALLRAGRADSRQPQDGDSWLAHSLILLARVMWDACHYERLLQDPTSQLPGRAEFQARLRDAFHAARTTGQPLGLLLVNPDGFGVINERLDREQGDRAIAEVARLLRSSLRTGEQIFRYGGAVFAVLMPAADAAATDVVARKLRQSLSGAYLDGAVRLTFSAGAAVYQRGSGEDAALDDLGLLRRADHALNMAKRAGGGCSVLWDAEAEEVPDAGVDRLCGIFTANTEKDYRNMLLLWDTVALMSAATERPRLVREFVERVKVALKPGRIALLEKGGTGGFRPLAGSPESTGDNGDQFGLDASRQALLHRAQNTLESTSGEIAGSTSGDGTSYAIACHAIPVPAGDRCLACLYLEGPADRFHLDSSDVVFLDALARQLGLALDRMALATRVQEEAELRSRRLREEVQDLRQALHSAKLIYQSTQMHAVLDTLRAVASTDVTVLIDGESGTGKEMLARAVHELSERREKPLVIVDCGAIAHNLIEAELFGYVKGAFTGAHGSSAGRIAQAEGGTLFLDEIGELPLDVQAKLLRFVQEKTISQVGSTTSRPVDTRIVAATNRDLGREAAAGHFREDLYYRLKVVTVTAPALRDRPDDILPLAKHFLDKFALQYEKPVRRFEPDAEVYLQQYRWPGNVRELQNCILRAVVLCTGDSIPRDALRVDEEREALPSASADTRLTTPPEFDDSAAPDTAPPGADPWSTLGEVLARQVDLALDQPVPLGRWLTEDLLREADEQAGGNARRAAAELGIPETTFRRQLDKVQRAEAQGLLRRSPAWTGTSDVLARLVEAARGGDAGNVVERAKTLLLSEVVKRVAGKDALGAELMGITVPTYRRWQADLPALPADAADSRRAG